LQTLNWHRVITESLEAANFSIEAEDGTLLPLDIAYPNILYEPRKISFDGQEIFLPFLELKFAGESVTPISLGGINKVSGIFVLNVRYSLNSGAVQVDDVAGEIVQYYFVGRVFSHDGRNIQIMSCSLESGSPDFGWYKTSISVKYQSYQ